MKLLVLATEYNPKKMHLYDCKTTGKHPVHLIGAGLYLTLDERDFGDEDMGWFFLNTKEYEYFKAHLDYIEV